MAGPTKRPKRPVDPEAGNNESSGEESESGTYHGQQEIMANFEGRNPESQDFHGIKQLLNQLFLKAHVDLSQMTDLIIAQHGIGCALKQEPDDSDDEDDAELSEESIVFGIASVINLKSQRETPCVQQFLSLLEELSNKHSEPPVQSKIKEVLNQQENIGFLINERFVNLPAVVSLSMLRSLSGDIEKMKKKDPSYDFAYYVMICKTCKPKDNNGEEIFSNDEEEFFCKEAAVNFEFSVEDESDTGLGGKWLSEDKQVVPFRRVLIFEANKLDKILENVSVAIQS
ncbi:hypothetical protein JTB14_005592 [Gonioctena quinquepunctata]|nr:hypothetical protein JTB14_005592 [Gonioctena quinquepunctata]